MDLFRGLKSGVPSGCLEETSIFKMIMIDDVSLCVKARIYMVRLIDFINFISYTDDIQDVSARTVGGQVTF